MGAYKNASDIFQNSNGNLIPLPESFCYKQITYNHYELLTLNGKVFAVGQDPKLNEGEHFTGDGAYSIFQAQKHKICHNADLLFSLLRLGDSKEKIDMLNSEKIIAWSKKYGLPFYSKDLLSNNKMGFSMAEFKEKVWVLICYFNFWQSDKNDKGIHLILGNEAKISIELSNVNDNIEYFLMAQDLFAAAYVQLIMLIANNRGAGIKKCSCCRNWFYPKRRNNKYCPLCSPQKAYKRTHHEKNISKAKDGVINA